MKIDSRSNILFILLIICARISEVHPDTQEHLEYMKSNGYYLTDHYAWSQTDAGDYIRAYRCPEKLIYSIISNDKHRILVDNAEYTRFRKNDRIDSEIGYDTICRFNNGSLWNSIGSNIIRQVIRAGHAKKMYKTFCERAGERIIISKQFPYHLFPTPEKVLSLSDEDYAMMGMSFKKEPLKNAAKFILENEDLLNSSNPSELAEILQTVKRIGPWTTAATLAEFTNDWSLYPYADAAIRFYAKEAKPSHKWPESDNDFILEINTLSESYGLSDTIVTLMTMHERKAYL